MTKRFAPTPRFSARRLPWLSSCALALWCVATFAANVLAQETPAKSSGHVSGYVRYFGTPDQPWRFQRYYVADTTKGLLAEAVVTLKSVDQATATVAPKARTIIVDQENFQFVPETTAIRVGDTIRFTNSDDSLHNVMLIHKEEAFNESMGKGETYEHTFRVPAPIDRPHRLGCVYHGAMRAWVFVFDHPFFAVTSKDGRFEFPEVPHGNYTLEVRHPAGRLVWSSPVVITSSDALEVDVRLTPNHIPKKPAKKLR